MREYTDKELIEMQNYSQEFYKDNLINIGDMMTNTKIAKSSNGIAVKLCKYCNKPLPVLCMLGIFTVHEKFCTCEKGLQDKKKHNQKVKQFRHPIDESNRRSLYYEKIDNMIITDKYNNALHNDIWMHNVECVVLELCGFDRDLLQRVKEQYRYNGFVGGNPIEYYNGLCDLYFVIQYGS